MVDKVSFINSNLSVQVKKSTFNYRAEAFLMRLHNLTR